MGIHVYTYHMVGLYTQVHKWSHMGVLGGVYTHIHVIYVGIHAIYTEHACLYTSLYTVYSMYNPSVWSLYTLYTLYTQPSACITASVGEC